MENGLMENGETANFHLFAANRQKMEEVCFLWSANNKRYCCFSKHAHLCLTN